MNDFLVFKNSSMQRFHRTGLLLGEAALERLASARITLAGLGGVGCAAVEALARAGIGHLHLIDDGVYTESNLNRQLYALESTLGRPKTEVAAERVRQINPACEVRTGFFQINVETCARVFEPPPEVLIDAIDMLSPKTGLLEAAVRHGVPHIISSMGAACRFDPTAVRIADLSATRHCRLARFVRKRLRKRGIHTGIRCIYSEEPGESGPAETLDLPDFEPPSRTVDGQLRPPPRQCAVAPAGFRLHRRRRSRPPASGLRGPPPLQARGEREQRRENVGRPGT